MSLETDYLRWRYQPHVGCVFARLIARDPARYGQKIVQLSGGGTPKRVAGNIARSVERMVNDKAVTAGVILLAQEPSLEHVTRIALALGEQPKWSVKTTTLPEPRAGNMVAIHIAREIPFGESECPSEALVLGPYAEFPPTRLAPVTALEIYVGEPRPLDPKTLAPTKKANLAHIELNLPSHSAFESMWRRSMEGRLQSLGAEDSRAKAKVSFVVPMDLASQLGCAP